MPKSPKPKTDKPNILVIWGDDIGIANLSCYSHGLMGYQTPNIDRLAKEGMMFTDSYGEQSCTAGRSSFITGQSVYRTGLSKVGIPGAPIGMNEKIITIAAALKNQGYATGQFGKNHLGDLNSMLPTNHGFDEFYGTTISTDTGASAAAGVALGALSLSAGASAWVNVMPSGSAAALSQD